MFVISKFVYDAMSRSELHATSPFLKILNYSADQHEQTFYRFRYGAPVVADRVGRLGDLSLKRGATGSVWSLEGFELSERVLGIFGQSSELFLKGFALIH